MRYRFGSFIAAAAAVVATLSVSITLVSGQGAQTKAPAPAATPAATRGQTAAPRGQATPAAAASPRVARIDGKPNFSGLWQAISGANWDIQDHSPEPGPFYQLG